MTCTAMILGPACSLIGTWLIFDDNKLFSCQGPNWSVPEDFLCVSPS